MKYLKNSHSMQELNTYFRDVGKHKLLKGSQEMELAEKIYQGQLTLYQTLDTIDSAFVEEFTNRQNSGDEKDGIERWHLGIRMSKAYMDRLQEAKSDKLYRSDFLGSIKEELKKKLSSLKKSTKDSSAKEMYDFLQLLDPEIVIPSIDRSGEISPKKIQKIAGDYLSKFDEIISQPERSEEILHDLEKSITEIYLEAVKNRNRMVDSNLRMVVSIAGKYFGRGIDHDDLVMEGNQGLIKAAERFDYRRGYKFITFASWWVRHHVQRFVEYKGSVIRIPVNVNAVRNKIFKAEKEIGKLQGIELSEISDEMISEKTDVPIEKINRYKVIPTITSYDKPASEDGMTLLDVIADDGELNPAERMEEQQSMDNINEMVSSALQQLPIRQQIIIKERYYEGKTLKKIGAELGLSRERIRQLQVDAEGKIKKYLAKKGIQQILNS